MSLPDAAIELEDAVKQSHDTSVINDLPVDLLADHIFAFVGSGQYVFVASVCTSFREAYGRKFPEKTSQCNLSSIQTAKICFELAQTKDKPFLQRLASHHSWYYYWRGEHLSDADMELLDWAKSSVGCPWNTCVLNALADPPTRAVAERPNLRHWAQTKFRFLERVGTYFQKAHRRKVQYISTSYNMTCIKDVKAWYEAAPAVVQPFLPRLCSGQPWYYFLHYEEMTEEDFALLRWAQFTTGCPWKTCWVVATADARTCAMAAQNGNLELLQWARAQGGPWDERTSASAAASGSLELLQWARANDCPWNETTCTSAARNGHLELLRWAHGNDCPWDESTCQAAAEGGHFVILQWARAQGCPWDECVCRSAAEHGHLELLQWARLNGADWGVDTCVAAALRGHLHILQWLHWNGCPWDEFTCIGAAEHGHLEILKWAHVHGCPWNKAVCEAAAQNGNLEVLKWARCHGCPWNEHTCSFAAKNGHLEVLQWARSHGCPWNERTCRWAAQNGHLAVLQWAQLNGCPWD